MLWFFKNSTASNIMFSACASAAISKTRRAGNCLRECQCVTADGVIPSIMANFLFPPSAAITLDISNSSTFQAPIKSYKPTDRKITKCKYYLLNYFMKFTKSSLLDKMDALGFNRINTLVQTHCGLPPWKRARITMPATKTSDVRCASGGLYVSASSWQDCPTGPPYTNFKKSASSLRRWQNDNHSPFEPVATSPFPLEKRNVVYVLCGKWSGSRANIVIQSMLSSASLSTPSVAACGATTVWANGPIAPPYFRVYSMLLLTICSLDMLVMKIGMLLDSIIKPKGEENVEQTSTERIKIS